MHRFYVPSPAPHGGSLDLPEAEAYHAHHVLRLRVGERVSILDGAGREYDGEVSRCDREQVTVSVRQVLQHPPMPYSLVLVQAITKGRSMELIVQKATELGVRRVVPLLSDRSAVHLDGEAAAAKAVKWQQTAAEAIKQCGLAWLPQVDAPLTPKAYLDRQEKFDLTLIGSLQPDRQSLRRVLAQHVDERGRLPESVAIWIGPEGDFTPAELHAAKGAGAVPIELGPLVLRSETAAIYSLSVLRYELQGL